MLKINLLPPYIHEGKTRRNVVILWVLIVCLVAGGMIAWMMKIKGETNDMNAQTAAITADADKADANQQRADSIVNANKEVVAKSTFVQGAQKHDTEVYPQLFHRVADYTWSRVKYDSIQPNGDAVNINAYTPLLRDIGQYMLAMERNPLVNRVDVTTNDLPSFPGSSGGTGQSADYRPPSGHTFQVRLELASAIPEGPTYAGGAAAAAGGAGGGRTGGMMSAGMMGGPGMGGPPGGSAGGMGSAAMMKGGAGAPTGGGATAGSAAK